MKIIYPEWEQPILLQENCVNCIYLENPRYFRGIIAELFRQIQGGEGKFILSEGEKVVALKKQIEMIFSPFLLDLEDKKFYTEIYKQLRSYAIGEDVFSETVKIRNVLHTYMLQLLDFMPYSLSLEDEIDLISLFKSLGIKIQYESEGIIEKLIGYMELVTDILKKDIFILVNLKTYFSEEEIEKIYATLLPRKIYIIDIEQQKKEYHFPFECDIIIDADLCEL